MSGITIKIRNTGRKAESIINMLKALSVDNDFIELLEDSSELPLLSDDEFKRRYSYSLDNMDKGISVNDLDAKLIYGKKI